jgi:hypothetical protein
MEKFKILLETAKETTRAFPSPRRVLSLKNIFTIYQGGQGGRSDAKQYLAISYHSDGRGQKSDVVFHVNHTQKWSPNTNKC